MNYELFHDESHGAGYWHGMLLIPIKEKKHLIRLLRKARDNTKYEGFISLKKIKRKGVIYGCAFSWITLGIASLASSFKKGAPQIYLGERIYGKKEYLLMPEMIGSKFILFCERDDHQLMTQYPDHASKIETTFRMGLKGGIHFLGNDKNPISIDRIHFDGHKHYSRHIDKYRIINRLDGLRDYCSIQDKANFIDDRGSNHNKQGSQDYEDCQLLQLTDLLVGSFRTLLGEKTKDIHGELALPVLSLIKRYQKGYARMRNSRWWSSFCMSQCYLDRNGWNFETIEYSKKNLQINLPFIKD